MEEQGFVELPVTLDHVDGIQELPEIQRDPFDRLLIAQAFATGFRLMTADPVIAQYEVPIFDAAG